MRPYKIYLNYATAMALENDLMQAKLTHPVLNEFLYMKYVKQIKKILKWKRKDKQPYIILRIINNTSLLLHNGNMVCSHIPGHSVKFDDLKSAGWLVDELDAKKDRTIYIGGK